MENTQQFASLIQDLIRKELRQIGATGSVASSDGVNELFEALSKAQGQMRNASLNCVNPFFKSKYADLAQIIDTIRKPLADNGLSFVQLPVSSDGKIGVITRLGHSSGQWIQSVLMLRPVKDDPQGLGSALTYARRYSLSSVVGISADADDDGNSASNKDKPKVVDLVTKEQIEILSAQIDETGTDLKKFCSAFKINSVSELPESKYKMALDALAKKKKKKGGEE